MSVYRVALAVVLVGGLVPAGFFLATFRPRQRGLRELDAGGWVAAIFGLYVAAAARFIGGQEDPTLWAGIVNLTIAAAVDGLLWVRVMYWRRIRHDVRRQAAEQGR